MWLIREGTIELTVNGKNLRLEPIHVNATIAVQGLDLTLAQVYLPPDSIVIDQSPSPAR